MLIALVLTALMLIALVLIAPVLTALVLISLVLMVLMLVMSSSGADFMGDNIIISDDPSDAASTSACIV